MSQLLEALVDICGPGHARAARSVDTVGGRRAGFVAVPATSQAVADVLHLATERGLTVVPRGSGSKVHWGAPRAADLLLDTARLGGMWDHDVAGATAEIGTGTPVRALQAALALHGQRLPVDPPSPTATVGGMLAVNESGPLRLRFGTPAQAVDRITYVDPGGNLAHSDGEQGRPGLAEVTGVIVSAAVRLQPLPAARRWVRVPATSPLQAVALAAGCSTAAAAIEADLPVGAPGTVAALFEGEEKEVIDEAGQLAEQWGSAAVVSPAAPAWWGVYPFGRDDVALRLSTSPADLASTVYAVADAAGRSVPVRGSVTLGSVHAVLPGALAPDRLEQIMDSLRHVLMARDGRVAVLSAPPELAAGIDMAARHEMF